MILAHPSLLNLVMDNWTSASSLARSLSNLDVSLFRDIVNEEVVVKTRWLGGLFGALTLMSLVSLQAQTQIPSGTAPDNTGINKRDFNNDGDRTRLTAEDQVRGSKADVELTRVIRQELMRKPDLSVDAQNIKIVTLNGLVTLRGPVASESEVEQVGAVAQKLAGQSKVRNELQVK